MNTLDIAALNFDKLNGLIPAIVQNADSGSVLMVGFMNREALEKTLREQKVTFWSRTRNRLWTKGETSGNELKIVSVVPDCDNDALLIAAHPTGPTCHTGALSCFEGSGSIIEELFRVIESRRISSEPDSYTARLLTSGLPAICDKIDEEAGEVIQAALSESDTRLTEESVDVLYHLFVLLAARGISLDALLEEMRRRRR